MIMFVWARAEEEPPEDFFEFTADDYQKVVAGQARERARAETGLRTQKLREAEMRRRAASLGPVPIRVHFPDDIILQARPPAVVLFMSPGRSL